jgi:hypothetical protein
MRGLCPDYYSIRKIFQVKIFSVEFGNLLTLMDDLFGFLFCLGTSGIFRDRDIGDIPRGHEGHP